MSLLKNLKATSELKDFTDEQLIQLADEVRTTLLESVMSSIEFRVAMNLRDCHVVPRKRGYSSQ